MFSNRIRIAGIILIVAQCSQSFVLLTANIEDVKKIARKFVSEPMAQQIADFIAKAAGQQKELPNFNPHAENLSAENEKNVDNVDNTSDNDDLNKIQRQGTSRRYRKQSRPTTARENRAAFENIQRVKSDFRDQSHSYDPPTEPTDIREQRTYYDREATIKQREQRGFDTTPRVEDRERERERDQVERMQERNRERSPKKQVLRPKQRGGIASGKDDQYLPLPESQPKSIIQDQQFQEHQRLKDQLTNLQTHVRDAASLTGPNDPVKPYSHLGLNDPAKPKRTQKQHMPSQQKAPLKRRPKYQNNQENQYQNPQSYKPQYKQQYQNQRPSIDQQYDQRQYRNKNQQFNQNKQHREHNKPPKDVIPSREFELRENDQNQPNTEYKLRENDQNQVYNDPGLKYKEYPDPKVDEDAERLTRETYQVDRQTRDYKTKILRQHDDAYEGTEASKYLRESDTKNYQVEDRVPMEADRIVSTDVQKEERERLSEPRDVNREIENREFEKGMNEDKKPAYDQVEYEQTPQRHRNRGRNRERFKFQDNDETSEPANLQEQPNPPLADQPNPRIPIAIPPAFNIAPTELTTAKVKNEFDQYDNIKAQPLVATSGPVGLKAAADWWPKESPVVRAQVDEPNTIDVQVAPVPINQPNPNMAPDAEPWKNADSWTYADSSPKDHASTMVINLVANMGEESTTPSPVSMIFATGFGNLDSNLDALTTDTKLVNIISTSNQPRRTTHQMRDNEETVVIDDNIFQYIQS